MSLGSKFIKLIYSDSSGAKSAAPVAQLPAVIEPPSRFQRVQSERRVKVEAISYNDYGRKRTATRYTACDWDPVPWTLIVWSNKFEKAEQFSLQPHPDIDADDLTVDVNWSSDESKSKSDLRKYGTPPERDERFRNRLIHYYAGDPKGIFLVDVRCLGEEISFFHRPRQERNVNSRQSLGGPPEPMDDLVRELPLPTPPTSKAPSEPSADPFAECADRVIRLHEQYEAAKTAVQARKLSGSIAQAALDELERKFQDQVAALDGSGGDAE